MSRVALNPEREARVAVAFNGAWDARCSPGEPGFETYTRRIAEFVDLYERLKAEQLAETGYLRLRG